MEELIKNFNKMFKVFEEILLDKKTNNNDNIKSIESKDNKISEKKKIH